MHNQYNTVYNLIVSPSETIRICEVENDQNEGKKPGKTVTFGDVEIREYYPEKEECTTDLLNYSNLRGVSKEYASRILQKRKEASSRKGAFYGISNPRKVDSNDAYVMVPWSESRQGHLMFLVDSGADTSLVKRTSLNRQVGLDTSEKIWLSGHLEAVHLQKAL